MTYGPKGNVSLYRQFYDNTYSNQRHTVDIPGIRYAYLVLYKDKLDRLDVLSFTPNLWLVVVPLSWILGLWWAARRRRRLRNDRGFEVLHQEGVPPA